MATTKVLGKVSLTLGGDYSDAVSYSRLTMVLAADGKGYVSKQDNTVGIEPAVTAGWENYWQLVTERGAGITSIQKTASGETADTYTIYYENGTTSTYQAENGKGYVADVTRSLSDDFSIMTGAYSVIDGAGWTDGYYLKNTGAVAATSGMKVMALTSVAEGTYTVAIRETAPFGAVASRVCGYDANGDFVRQLATFDIPTSAGLAKKTVDTTGCAQIRISACSNDAVAVYAGASIDERVDAVEAAQERDNAPVIIATATGAVASFADGADDMPMELHIGIEPVQAGSGDPSPTNVRPITGWTGCNVVRTGANVLQNADFPSSSQGISCAIVSDDNSVVLSGTAQISIGFTVAKASVKKGATYTVAVDGVNNSCYVNVRAYNGATFVAVLGTYKTAGSLTFTVSDTYDIVDIRPTVASGATITNQVVKYSLGVGSTPAPYAPYTGTTLPVAFPSAAGTVYGGELTVNRDGSGTLTVDHAIQTRKLSEFAVNETLTNTIHYMYASNFFGAIRPKHNVNGNVCNIAPSEYSQSDITHFYVGVSTGRADLWVPTSTSTDTDVQISITASAPIATYTLTAGQVKTLLGANAVWADTGDTTANYPADTKLYIDAKVAELQALILENT